MLQCFFAWIQKLPFMYRNLLQTEHNLWNRIFDLIARLLNFGFAYDALESISIVISIGLNLILIKPMPPFTRSMLSSCIVNPFSYLTNDPRTIIRPIEQLIV